MAISRPLRRSNGDLDTGPGSEPDDVHDILDADDLAAELLADADEPPTTAMPRLEREARERRAHAQHAQHVQHVQHVRSPPSAAHLPPSAAALAARLEQAEAELTRVRRHMRARDAYLVELERALQASTSKLEASGIGSVEDAHKLFGRVRGQAFRIAELESELRVMEQRLSRLARFARDGVTG